MTRLLTITFIAAVLAAPVYADVTLKQTINGKGMGMTAATTGTTYIKGHKMRSDVQLGDKVQTTIFDLDAQKMFVFDSKKKDADVWDMAAFATELSANVDTQNMKVSLKPNGQSKTIAGATASGYDLEISVPASMGGSKDMSMLVTLSGPTWIVKDAPGTADYIAFYKAAAEKGWIFSDPRAAKGAPGQARAMTEMYRQLADTGGIAYETNMEIKMSANGGGNPLGGLLARMGNMTAETTLQSVETGSLAETLFSAPPDYKLNARK
jgi:hypothetical protein